MLLFSFYRNSLTVQGSSDKKCTSEVADPLLSVLAFTESLQNWTALFTQKEKDLTFLRKARFPSPPCLYRSNFKMFCIWNDINILINLDAEEILES